MSISIRTMAGGLALLAMGSGAIAAQAEPDVVVGARATAVPAIDYILRAGLSYTDNLFASPTGLETSTGAVAVGAELRGKRETGRLTYDASADMLYSVYFSGDDSQLFGNAFFDGTYAFVPDTFFWNGLFRYDQVRNDFSRPLAPGNIGDQVTWSTGPELRLRMGRTLEAQLEGHYESQTFSGSYSDSNTLGGRALLAHRSGPRSLVALGGSYDQVSYADDSLSALYDFDRTEAFARIEHSGARTRVDAEVGYASVSGGTFDDSGPMFRGSLSRKLTPTLNADVSYAHEYPTSSGPNYTQDASDPGLQPSGAATLSSAPRVADTLNAGLSMNRTRTQARLTYQVRNEESLIQAYGQRDYNELRFFVARQFTPKASGEFFASRAKEDFSAFADDSTETNVGAGLTILLGSSLGMELRVQHRDRSAENPANSSKEFSGGLFFRYAGAFGRRGSLGDDVGSQLR